MAATFFVIAAGIFLCTHFVERPMLRGPHGYVLADPDSYLRWRLVERALGGEGARIRWIHEDNGPHGRPNEWTSPTTTIGVAGARALSAAGMEPAAARTAWAHWMGPTIGLLGLAALAAVGSRAGGWPLAACLVIAWPLPPVIAALTRFGNTDHHSLHLLLFILMIGTCLARRATGLQHGGARPARRGAALGLLGGLALWSAGTEMLPACGLITMLALWESWWNGRDGGVRVFWRAWWIAGATATAAALLYEFWPAPLHRRLEFLSPWHVVLWLIAGGLIEHLARRPSARAALFGMVGGACAAALSAAALRGFDWSHLHVVQDPRFGAFDRVVAEFQPYAAGGGVGRTLQLAWTDWGLLPLVLLMALALPPLFARRVAARRGQARTDRETRDTADVTPRWLLVCVVIYLVLTVYQTRWSAYFTTLLIVTTAHALRRALPHRPLRSAVVMAIAVLPVAWWWMQIAANVHSIGGDALQGPFLNTFALEAASRAIAAAHPNEPPVVLAPWSHGGTLSGMAKARPIGSQYWSNLDGLTETLGLFTEADDARFLERCNARTVRYLVLPDQDTLLDTIVESFVATRGRNPSAEELQACVVWRLAGDPGVRTLAAPELEGIAPDWKIIDLPAARADGAALTPQHDDARGGS